MNRTNKLSLAREGGPRQRWMGSPSRGASPRGIAAAAYAKNVPPAHFLNAAEGDRASGGWVVSMLPYNKRLVANARRLRKNMTREEKHLWYDFLKHLPLTVKRQHNIENCIADFYIAEKKIVIELDGVQHTRKENARADAERDAALAAWGICVLRYANHDVNRRFGAVADDILKHLDLTYQDLING